ncbi:MULTISPECIES: alpha/beta fold hydrolase [Streptomyces]|uniref:alpha/beta fold hydrolase n=1 Tax=Streptomyces TaxID=1883 RepID=UPI001E2FEB7C|nr:MULTISPECIES: alpha/beta fold hydrolase [Streptomyces]WCL88930.1 alpha/beta fold hydrolase [Streptomyces sp. JCM 35825]
MYAAAHPDKVRAIVLDGAVSPDLTASEFRLSSFTGLQARFGDFAALCAKSPDCVLGPTPRLRTTACTRSSSRSSRRRHRPPAAGT